MKQHSGFQMFLHKQSLCVCYLEIRQSLCGCEELGTLQRDEGEDTSCDIVMCKCHNSQYI